jgi:16S rRNA (uracil1498-N3)-methyltransferase
VKNILRLRAGDKIVPCDGKLNEAQGIIDSFQNQEVEVIIKKAVKNVSEPNVRLTVYCSILKRENFEPAVQKLTEIGAAKIVPIIAENTVKQGIKAERLEAIIKEAAEQSGRGIIPQISGPILLSDAFKQSEDDDARIIFDISGKQQPSFPEESKNISVFIGPEGGWDEKEIESARQSGVEVISLGELTLRAETAAIVGSYPALHAGDFR